MKNKILAISIIFILLSFAFINSNVFAVSSTDVAKGVDDTTLQNCLNHELYNPDTMEYLVFKEATNNHFVYFIYYYKSSGISPYVKFYEDEGLFKVILGDSTNTLDYILVCQGTDVRHCYDTSLVAATSLNFASSVSVYNHSTNSYFFQLAPVTLAETLEATNPIQMWKEQMKNVVVSLAVFLAGLVAFLKAWAWLKTQLRKA